MSAIDMTGPAGTSAATSRAKASAASAHGRGQAGEDGLAVAADREPAAVARGIHAAGRGAQVTIARAPRNGAGMHEFGQGALQQAEATLGERDVDAVAAAVAPAGQQGGQRSYDGVQSG